MESLLERARDLSRKMGRIGLKNLIWGKNEVNRHIWRNIKGSRKDPLLYLGAISVALFLVVSLASPVPSSLSNANLVVSGGLHQADSFVVPGTKIQESPDLSLMQKNSLTAVSPPIMVTPQVLGALIEATDYNWTQQQITEYTVQPGDTLWSISDAFNISIDTILWANDLTKYTLLQIGQKLVILPTSGTVHHVKNGDTLGAIAKTYKTETDKIVAFNNLSAGGDIYIGDILIIPGGVKPAPIISAPAWVPMASSYFICPISSPCRITYGLHWYNAIDFSHGKCGDAVYAAAAGTVLKVKLTSSRSKWAYGGAGNHLTILHPNGVVTYYGHVQTSFVNPGDYVSQGKVIGLVGGAPGTKGAGLSTGCHLHFGVSGARNPFNR